MEKAYAQAVEKVVAQGMDPKTVATRLEKVLASRGHMKLLPKIMRALRTSGKVGAQKAEVTMHIARAQDESPARVAAKEYLTTEPRVVIDDTLIGGWALTTVDTRIDASFKKHLLDLYRKITH